MLLPAPLVQGWALWLGCMVAVAHSGPSDAMLLAEPSLIIPPPQRGTGRGHALVIPTGASQLHT